MNTPTYTYPKYPNFFSKKICYKKILAKTHPNFSPSNSHIHNTKGA